MARHPSPMCSSFLAGTPIVRKTYVWAWKTHFCVRDTCVDGTHMSPSRRNMLAWNAYVLHAIILV